MDADGATHCAEMTAPQVIVVGSFNQDLVWNTPAFPRPGETVTGLFRTGPGGKGSNQAVAAARAGAATAFVGAVGDDVFGSALPGFYEKEGIGPYLAVKNGLPTGNAGILVNGMGQNEIIVALGANEALAPEDVPTALFETAKIVVCQHESNPGINRHVFELARRTGAATFLNPAPMRDDFEPSVLELVDILAPNETEFVALVKRLGWDAEGSFSEEALAGMTTDELQTQCRRFGVRCVVVTLGSRGCFVSTEENGWLIPACREVEVVDTTGAGDAFVGGFCAGYVRYDGDVYRAALYGTATAGLSVSKAGAASSMPQKEDIEAMLKRQEKVTKASL